MYDLQVELIFAERYFLRVTQYFQRIVEKTAKIEKIRTHKNFVSQSKKKIEKHEKATKQQDATNLKPLVLLHFYPDCKKYRPINIPNVANQM